MKTSIITLRVNNELREKLESISQETNISVSEIGRNAIEDHLNSFITNDEGYESSAIRSLKKDAILDDFDLTQLLLWIYEIRRDPSLEFFDDKYYQFVKTIEKINNDPLFTEEIKLEFNKIHRELVLYLNEELDNKNFTFYRDLPESCNYLKISDFIFDLRISFTYVENKSDLSEN